MNVRSRFSRFNDDQEGGMTIFLLIWMIIFFIFGGLAVDSSNAWRERAVLQATADAAALAAVLDIEVQPVALVQANLYAEKNMPASDHGDVLLDADVEFGNWTSGVFTREDDFGEDLASPDDVNAVRTTTFRAASNANRLPTFFLSLAGFRAWEVSAQAVATRYREGSCLDYENVIMANGWIKLLPGSTYAGSICIHSNEHVQVMPGTQVTDGAYVSMTHEDDESIHDAFLDANPQIKLEGDEYVGHPGLYDALQGNNDVIVPSMDIAAMTASIYAGETEYLPQGVPADDSGEVEVPAAPVFTDVADGTLNPTSIVSIDLKGGEALPAAFVSGTLYKFDCGKLGKDMGDMTASLQPGGGTDFAGLGAKMLDAIFGDLFSAHAAEGITYGGNTITFTSGLSGVAIVSDCNFKFNGGQYEDAIFATTSSHEQAVQVVNSTPTVMGRDDDCEPGGEVTFLIPNSGDFHGSAKTSWYDVNIYGMGDLELAAQGGDVGAGTAVGMDIQVAGDAQIEALADFTGCGATNSYEYEPWSFRLVQ